MKKLAIFLLTTVLLLGGRIMAQTLIIAEVADPKDNSNCRYVKLYNATNSTIDFSTDVYYLCRQANGGTSWGDIQLTGQVGPGEVYVVAYSQSDFESQYGQPANQYSSYISGSGDDGYFLYHGGDHTSGELFDAYGVIDQDGTGTDWEYTDGHAYRNVDVCDSSATWNSSEWTIERPKNAGELDPFSHTCNCPNPATPKIQTAKYFPDPKVVVTYDLTLSSVDPADYILKINNSTNITFSTATLLPDQKTVELTNPSSSIPDDAQIDSIIDNQNNTKKELYAGFVDIKYLNTAYSTVVENNVYMCIKGVVVADNDYRHVILADAEGAYNSVEIYDAAEEFPGQVNKNDSIVVIGYRSVNNNQTQFIPDSLWYSGSPSSLTISAVKVSASVVDTNAAADNANSEPYESVLVKVDSLEIIQDKDGYYVYRAQDSKGNYGVYIDDRFDYRYSDGLVLLVGHTYNITGIVLYEYGAYRLNPRGINDIQEVLTNIGENEPVGRLYPNPVEDKLVVLNIKKLVIYDNLGRLIRTYNFNGNATIDLDLPPGMYIAKYVDVNNNSKAQVLIKK